MSKFHIFILLCFQAIPLKSQPRSPGGFVNHMASYGNRNIFDFSFGYDSFFQEQFNIAHGKNLNIIYKYISVGFTSFSFYDRTIRNYITSGFKISFTKDNSIILTGDYGFNLNPNDDEFITLPSFKLNLKDPGWGIPIYSSFGVTMRNTPMNSFKVLPILGLKIYLHKKR